MLTDNIELNSKIKAVIVFLQKAVDLSKFYSITIFEINPNNISMPFPEQFVGQAEKLQNYC